MQFTDVDAFINKLLQTQPPIPYYWPRMKQVNAKGPDILGALPEPPPLGPKEFKTLLADRNIQLLDTRNMLGFGGGHIPGALNIGHSSSVSMWGGWLLDPERPIAIVTPPQGAAREVVDWLVRVGLEKFAGTLQGGMDAWTKHSGKFASIPQMSMHELNKRTGERNLQILDVRMPSEWDMGHLPNARYMFLPEIPKRLGELDRTKPVVTYCGTGYRASIAASLLKRAGFEVSSVPGGFDGWLVAGFDVVVPDAPGKASDTRRS
jgi:hydroxyacylglutathione hydrolase